MNNHCKYILSIALLVTVAPLLPAVVTADEAEVLYWVAPMDSNYRRDKPGKSPMGMDLIPVYAESADNGDGGISIAPEVVQNLGVRTAIAERSRLWRGIDTVGYVDYDESLVSHIHLRTEGWIENLVVQSEGERVSKGDRLFDLYSPDLVNAQEEFLQALKLDNKGMQQASKDRLAALGVSAGQIQALQKSRRVQQTGGGVRTAGWRGLHPAGARGHVRQAGRPCHEPRRPLQRMAAGGNLRAPGGLGRGRPGRGGGPALPAGHATGRPGRIHLPGTGPEDPHPEGAAAFRQSGRDPETEHVRQRENLRRRTQ